MGNRNRLAACAALILCVSGCGEREKSDEPSEVATPEVVAQQTDGESTADLDDATAEDLVDPPTLAAIEAETASGRSASMTVVRGEAVREPEEDLEDRQDNEADAPLLIKKAFAIQTQADPPSLTLDAGASSPSDGGSVDPPSLNLDAGASSPSDGGSVDPPSLNLDAGASSPSDGGSVDPPSLSLDAGASSPSDGTRSAPSLSLDSGASSSDDPPSEQVEPPSLTLDAGASSPSPAAAQPVKPIVRPLDLTLLVPRHPGETVASYELGADAPKKSFGLAYRGDVTPARLLVSDYSKNEIVSFSVGSTLSKVGAETIDTAALDARFVNPRGLAFRSGFGVPYLFALTSNDEGAGRVTRLWRVNLDSMDTINANLSRAGLGIGTRKAFGLALRGTTVYVSYDSSDFPTNKEQVRKGILRLRVSFTQPASSAISPMTVKASVAKAPALTLSAKPAATTGSTLAAVRVLPVTLLSHVPNSGRKMSDGNAYGRAPSFGLAVSAGDDGDLLWGTSYNKILYVAEARRGRGIFQFDSPGKKKTYGLASGGGYLWAVDRPANNTATVYKIAIAKGSARSKQGEARTVRHLRMILKSKAKTSRPNAGASHNFARVHTNSRRPNQGRDSGSYAVTHNRPAQVNVPSYLPAGDSSSRQYYTRVLFNGPAAKDQVFTSTLEVDFWTSSRRQFVYPERCDTTSSPGAGYLSDDAKVYQLYKTANFNGFITRVNTAIAAEYGSGAVSNNPYWQARNIVEYVTERFTYGNVSDKANGHYSYMPAAFKVRLPFDGIADNSKLSCSSSTFSLVATLRCLGVPARWVGTTKFRTQGKAKGVEVDDYDLNDNNLFEAGETSLDTSFHRWAEVWMGPRYGWQRFDPTPSSEPSEQSQYNLMRKCAMGVGTSDLVLTVGSGLEEPFYDPKDKNQRYNSVPTYTEPSDWSTLERRRILWTNACFLNVTPSAKAITKGANKLVRWTTSGRWDLDPSATVSIFAKNSDGDETLLSAGTPWSAGSTRVDLSSLDAGTYRYVIRKDGDTLTGGQGSAFSLR